LLECKTYRYFGHYVGDPLTYRTKEEAEEWRQKRDPLMRFAERVVGEGLVEDGNLRRIDREVSALIDAAVEAAEKAPLPDAAEVLTDVYVKE
jgi:pyruvate dehydrogenase E1 component alpha subunit